MGASLSREAREVLASAREGDADAVAASFASQPRLSESVTLFKRLSPLHLAAAAGHSDVIRAVMAPLVAGVRAEVAAGAYPGPATKKLRRGVNSRDLFHRTPLLLAAKRGHLEAARALVESAANVFAQDRDANTSLHYAALHGHGDVVSYLLQRAEARGVLHRLVNRRNVSGFTALHFAVWGRHGDAALALLLAGADPHAANDRVFDAWLPVPVGCTPLHLAVMRQSMDLVWLLLEHYASQEVGRLPGTPAPLDPRLATNLYGLNPAQMAAHIGFRPAVRVLLPHVPVQALFQSRDVEALRVQGARSLKALAGAAAARLLLGQLDALELRAREAQELEEEEARRLARKLVEAEAEAAEMAGVVEARREEEVGGRRQGPSPPLQLQPLQLPSSSKETAAGGPGDDDDDDDDNDDDDDDDDLADDQVGVAAASDDAGRASNSATGQQQQRSSCCPRCSGGAASGAPSPSPLPPRHRRSASDGTFSQPSAPAASSRRGLCAKCITARGGSGSGRRRRARLSEPSSSSPGGDSGGPAAAAAAALALALPPRSVGGGGGGGMLVRSLTPPASLMLMHQHPAHASARLRLTRRRPSASGLSPTGGSPTAADPAAGDGGAAAVAAAAGASAASAAGDAPPPAAPCPEHGEEDDDWDNDNTCGLCLDALARVAVAGCGHASCVPCARRLSECLGGRVPLCPFCRQAIRGWALREAVDATATVSPSPSHAPAAPAPAPAAAARSASSAAAAAAAEEEEAAAALAGLELAPAPPVPAALALARASLVVPVA